MNPYDQWEHVQEGVQYMKSGASPRGNETVVAERVWVRVLMWTGLSLLGAGAGWLLKSVAGWVASLPWAPLQGPFELADQLIASFGEPQATIGALAIGTVAGLVLAFFAEQESLTVAVSHGQVSMKRGEFARRIERASVNAVFLDGKQLVLLGREAEELAREASDLDAERIQAAFLAHGYPWRADGDPYKDEYRLWVEDTPDLPAGADALLKARARALGRGDDGREDAAELRAELARLGVVVREEKKRQYWRRVREPRFD
jgi:hypothetical protein